ncbi:MAG: T9SS type A sorting domain-containing protein, partial [Nitrospinae bacterium]|nr:T9SS type A sorting domain-containing protein [Nitrospinota bacterium]
GAAFDGSELVGLLVQGDVFNTSTSTWSNVQCSFSNNQPLNYHIYNQVGALVKSDMTAGYDAKINIADLPCGVYTLKIENASKVYKVVKQ